MEFPSAFNVLTNGRAAKRGHWGGYLKKEDIANASSEVTGAYYTFVNRAGAQYIYQYTSSTGLYSYVGKVDAGTGGALKYATAALAVAAGSGTGYNPSATLDLDVDLFAGMSASDWSYGDTASYERARSGNGTW